MATGGLRGSLPVLGLGLVVAAVALTGVGIAASGAADPSHPASLNAAKPVTEATLPVSPATESAAPAATAAVTASAAPSATAGGGASTTTSPTAQPGTTATETTAPAKTAAPSARATSGAKSVKKSSKPAPSRATPGSSSAATAAPAAPAAASVGAKPGDYAETTAGKLTYTGGGMPVNGTSTLTVDPASGQAQTQTSKDGNNSTVEKLVFGTDRVDAMELSITSAVLDSDFVLTPQEPLVELTPGATWSWKADSTDGKEHLALSGSYAGTETVVVGGVSETTAIVKSTLVVTGSIATTITQTDDYDPTYRLILREHQVAKGTYSGFAYTADVTTTLNSLTPS